MLLVIEVGNTNTKIGVYDGARLLRLLAPHHAGASRPPTSTGCSSRRSCARGASRRSDITRRGHLQRGAAGPADARVDVREVLRR